MLSPFYSFEGRSSSKGRVNPSRNSEYCVINMNKVAYVVILILNIVRIVSKSAEFGEMFLWSFITVGLTSCLKIESLKTKLCLN